MAQSVAVLVDGDNITIKKNKNNHSDSEKEKIQKETNSEGQRNIELANIQTEAQKLITESVNYNNKLKADYDIKVKDLSSLS